MIPAERRAQILREIEVRGALNVTEFSLRTGLSNMTIRRDLALLDGQGLVERVYGGAVPIPTPAGAGAVPAGRRLPLAVLGMVVPSADYYFSKVIDGARAAAAELGVRLILAISDYSPAAELRQIERLLSNGVDGLLVTPSTPYAKNPQTYSRLAGAGLPVVVVERSLDEAPADFTGGAVRSDHFRGAQLAVQHLVELGHANIGLAWRRSPTSDHVRAGFFQSMAKLAPHGEMLELELPIRGTPPAELEDRLVSFLRQCGAKNVRAALMLPDEAAMHFLDIAQDRSMQIPRDFSVVAYDDEVASLGAIPLTAVAPPKFDVGYMATQLCFERIISAGRSEQLPALARVGLLPQLVVRESTGPCT